MLDCGSDKKQESCGPLKVINVLFHHKLAGSRAWATSLERTRTRTFSLRKFYLRKKKKKVYTEEEEGNHQIFKKTYFGLHLNPHLIPPSLPAVYQQSRERTGPPPNCGVSTTERQKQTSKIKAQLHKMLRKQPECSPEFFLFPLKGAAVFYCREAK